LRRRDAALRRRGVAVEPCSRCSLVLVVIEETQVRYDAHVQDMYDNLAEAAAVVIREERAFSLGGGRRRQVRERPARTQSIGDPARPRVSCEDRAPRQAVLLRTSRQWRVVEVPVREVSGGNCIEVAWRSVARCDRIGRAVGERPTALRAQTGKDGD
jgi:hypothetical protein